MEALTQITTVNDWIQITVEQRESLKEELATLPFVEEIYPSDANFILVRMSNAREIYNYLSTNGIIVRDRSRILLCNNCLRITIGTPDENTQLITTLKNYKPSLK